MISKQKQIEKLLDELQTYNRKDLVRALRGRDWWNKLVHDEAGLAIRRGMSESLQAFVTENFFIVLSVLTREPFNFGKERLYRFANVWEEHVEKTKKFLEERKIDECISTCREMVEAKGFDYDEWNKDGKLGI